VAYNLDLVSYSELHPVFYMSCLKPKLGAHVIPLSSLPHVVTEGVICSELKAKEDEEYS